MQCQGVPTPEEESPKMAMLRAALAKAEDQEEREELWDRIDRQKMIELREQKEALAKVKEALEDGLPIPNIKLGIEQ